MNDDLDGQGGRKRTDMFSEHSNPLGFKLAHTDRWLIEGKLTEIIPCRVRFDKIQLYQSTELGARKN